MKKRFVSLLVVVCMLLTLAAFPRGEVFRLGNDGVFSRFFVEICQVL